MEKIKLEDIDEIKDRGLKPNDWLWCLHCERFFQVKDIRIKKCYGIKEYGCFCPFEGCDGKGIEIDLWGWNDWNEVNGISHWPKSEKELHKGMRSRLYPLTMKKVQKE